MSGGDSGNDNNDDGPVTSLPNTGVGSNVDASDSALIALLTGFGTIAAATALRRRNPGASL